MTLKSLKTRNVKSIRKMAAAVVLVLVTVSPLSVTLRTAHAARTQPGDNALLAPLVNDQQKLIASDAAAFDRFGYSVAFNGSTVVVGGPQVDIGGNANQGAVYVFTRQGGSWVEEQKLTASDGAVGDNFGFSVGVSGSTIVVSAWLDDAGGNADQGSVYVFTREEGSWVETQKLTASDAAAKSVFGFSLAFSGSAIVVGAPGADFSLGSAYVFTRQGGNWVEEQELTASDRLFSASFGLSVGIGGSTVVVGAPSDNLNRGSAYIFTRQGGSWVETQKLSASDKELFDGFGLSVAISGSTLVISSERDDTGSNIDQGSVYVFTRQRGNWVEEQKLTASDGGPSDFFGHSVGVSGSTIVVGAPFKTLGGIVSEGLVYVFNRDGGSWVEEQKLTASDAAPSDFFGESLAISGSTVVVGADNGGNIHQGAGYVFY